MNYLKRTVKELNHFNNKKPEELESEVDLTKILLPKRLVLTYSLIAKGMHYQILYTELKSSC